MKKHLIEYETCKIHIKLMNTWLMKSEPSEYSIDDLARHGQSSWFGVRNYQARNYMRDSMRVGDRVLFYHSSCLTPGVYGIARVASEPHDDETQFELWGKHYEPRSTRDRALWQCVDVGYISTLEYPITLADIRATPGLETMRILQKGNRLSITPVTDEEWGIIEEMM